MVVDVDVVSEVTTRQIARMVVSSHPYDRGGTSAGDATAPPRRTRCGCRPPS